LAAAAFLLLLLTTMEAEAIRLDAEIRAAVNQQQQVAYVSDPDSSVPESVRALVVWNGC
jgi:hypothetical protein